MPRIIRMPKDRARFSEVKLRNIRLRPRNFPRWFQGLAIRNWRLWRDIISGFRSCSSGRKRKPLRIWRNVAANSKDRTLGNLAKKVLATEYVQPGNYRGAREMLEGMIRDPQCDLPKEDLNIDLSKALVAQGKRDEAIKVLRDASAQGAQFSPHQAAGDDGVG